MISLLEWVGIVYVVGVFIALPGIRTDLAIGKRFTVALIWPIWVWNEDGI